MAAHNIPTDLKKLPPIQLSGLPQRSKYKGLKFKALNFKNPQPKTDPGSSTNSTYLLSRPTISLCIVKATRGV